MIAVTALAGNSQFGAGLNGGTTDICHLMVSQAFCDAKVVEQSCVMLFVDLAGAFSSVARRIVMPCLSESEEAQSQRDTGHVKVNSTCCFDIP